MCGCILRKYWRDFLWNWWGWSNPVLFELKKHLAMLWNSFNNLALGKVQLKVGLMENMEKGLKKGRKYPKCLKPFQPKISAQVQKFRIYWKKNSGCPQSVSIPNEMQANQSPLVVTLCTAIRCNLPVFSPAQYAEAGCYPPKNIRWKTFQIQKIYTKTSHFGLEISSSQVEVPLWKINRSFFLFILPFFSTFFKLLNHFSYMKCASTWEEEISSQKWLVFV